MESALTAFLVLLPSWLVLLTFLFIPMWIDKIVDSRKAEAKMKADAVKAGLTRIAEAIEKQNKT